MGFDKASTAPEKPSDTSSQLNEAMSSINKEIFGDIMLALKGVGNPETQSASLSYLFSVITKLSQGRLSEISRFGEDEEKEKGQESPASATAKAPETEDETQDTDEALDRAEVPVEEPGKRSGKGTEQMPYRALFTEKGIANGGCPGYIDGNGKFDANLAETQLRGLHARGIRHVVSLVQSENIHPVILKLQTEGIDIAYTDAHLNTNSMTLTSNNIQIFERLAKMNNVYVHCRHGAHRAIIATAGALIKKGARSLNEAFEQAGGNLKNFMGRDYAIPMLSQLIEYAQKEGALVDLRYLAAIDSIKEPSS